MNDLKMPCPNCGQEQMHESANQSLLQNMLICDNCKSQVDVQLYLTAMMLSEHDILIQTIRYLLTQGVVSSNTGVCIQAKNNKWIVGFIDNQLYVQKCSIDNNFNVGEFVSLTRSQLQLGE